MVRVPVLLLLLMMLKLMLLLLLMLTIKKRVVTSRWHEGIIRQSLTAVHLMLVLLLISADVPKGVIVETVCAGRVQVATGSG